MKTIVIDLETTVDSNMPFSATPMDKDNFIVSCGIITPYGDYRIWDYRDGVLLKNFLKLAFRAHPRADDEILLVGHNIKFDYQYLYKHVTPLFDDYDVYLWDTMQACYIHSGQRMKSPSLERTHNYYYRDVSKTKLDAVTEMWNHGVATQDIDKDLLHEYLMQDLKLTKEIFDHQQRVMSSEMTDVLMLDMKMIKVCAHMEMNGMWVDNTILDTFGEYTHKLMGHYTNQCLDIIKDDDTLPDAFKEAFNLASPKHLSLYFFGGTFKFTDVEPACDEDGNEIYYKTGKRAGHLKYRKVTKEVDIPRKASPVSFPKESTSVNEETLKRIAVHRVAGWTACLLAEKLLSHRKWSKQYNTYYAGMKKHIYPSGFIHGSLNMAVTATGRLASSKPNLQNFSR